MQISEKVSFKPEKRGKVKKVLCYSIDILDQNIIKRFSSSETKEKNENHERNIDWKFLLGLVEMRGRKMMPRLIKERLTS